MARPPSGSRGLGPRRAAALASVVLVIAILNLVMIGAVTGSGDDAVIAARRVETLRAFLAAESGVHAAVAEINAGREPPTGQVGLPGGETMEIVTPGGTPPYDATVVGRLGIAERRVVISID